MPRGQPTASRKAGQAKGLGPIRTLAKQISALREKAKAAGGPVDDRELLACLGCGFMEDVLVNGVLITCRAPALGRDTGLRFRKVGRHSFRCPECGSILPGTRTRLARTPGLSPMVKLTGGEEAR